MNTPHLLAEVPLPAGGGDFRDGRPGMIIVHCMAEWIQPSLRDAENLDVEHRTYHATEWLRALGLSAHAFITPAGIQIESKPTDRIAYHAGPDYNSRALGVEMLVSGVWDYAGWKERIRTSWCPVSQADATARLVAGWAEDLASKNGESPRIVPHAAVDSQKVDPGEGFDWLHFLELVRFFREGKAAT